MHLNYLSSLVNLWDGLATLELVEKNYLYTSALECLNILGYLFVIYAKIYLYRNPPRHLWKITMANQIINHFNVELWAETYRKLLKVNMAHDKRHDSLSDPYNGSIRLSDILSTLADCPKMLSGTLLTRYPVDSRMNLVVADLYLNSIPKHLLQVFVCFQIFLALLIRYWLLFRGAAVLLRLKQAFRGW